MSDTSATGTRGKGLRFDLQVLGPILALILLIVIGTILNPGFLAPRNITNVLSRSAFTGIIAVGMTFVITAGSICRSAR